MIARVSRATLTAVKGGGLQVVAVVAVIVLGAVLRLSSIDLIDYRFDQAYPQLYAMDIASGRLFWLVQPHGSVSQHPGLYLWMIAAAYAFTRDFGAIVVYRISLDIISVGLCYWIGSRYFNWRVGLIAALLYAVAPWAIQYSRNLWPVTQPLTLAVLLIGLLEIAQRQSARGWLITAIGLGLVAGIHLSGVYVLPAAVAIMIYARKSFAPRMFLVGLTVPMVVAVAFLVHDAGQDFINVRSLITTVGGPSFWTMRAVDMVLDLSGGHNLSSLTGQAFLDWTLHPARGLEWIDDVQRILVAASFGLCLAWATRALFRPGASSADRAVIVLAAVLFIPLAFMLRQSDARPINPQYLTFIYPAVFLVAGVAADRLLERANRPLRWLGLGMLAGMVIWHVFSTARFTQFVASHDTLGGYGKPVRSLWSAVRAAGDAIAGTPDRVIIALPSFPSHYDEAYAVAETVSAGLPHTYLDARESAMVFGATGQSYVFYPEALALRSLLDEVFSPAQLRDTVVPIGDSSQSGFVFTRATGDYRFDQAQAVTGVTWDNGISLVAYRARWVSATELTVDTLMRVEGNPPAKVDYHWYVHLFNGDQRVAQNDSSGAHPSFWLKGDMILHRATLRVEKPMPPGAQLRLRIGSYTYPSLKAVLVTVPSTGAREGGVDLPLP